jgi:hypothetical protein
MTGTATQIDFKETLRDYPQSTRRAFVRLDDDSKVRVIKMFVRHKRACDSFGMAVDPYFIMDAIIECRNEAKAAVV